MHTRPAIVWMAVIATLGVVWPTTPTGQSTNWQIVDLDTGKSRDPDLAVNAAGNAVAVWINQSRTRAATFRAAAGAWSPVVTLSSGTDMSTDARVGTNAAGDAVAVWRAVRSTDATPYLAVSQYSAATNAWSSALELPTNGHLPQAVIDAQGNVVVVWAEFLRDEGFYYGWVYDIRSVTYDALTGHWSTPVTLSEEYAWQQQLVIDPAGVVTLLWGRLNFVESRRWSPDIKSWSGITAVATASSFMYNQDYSPRLAVDAGGNVVAVFTDIFKNLVGSRFSSATQTWSTPVLVADDPVVPGPDNSGKRGVVGVDAAGNATVVYVARQSAEAGVLRSRTYAVATNAWSEPTDIATDVDPSGVDLAIHPGGGAAVAFLAANESVMVALRPAGQQWTVEPGAESAAATPRIGTDDSGSLHVLWSRTAAPETLRAARLSTLVAPTIRRITSSSGTLTIDFTTVAAATNYEYSLDDGATWTARTPISTQSPIVVSGLVDGAAYPLRVRATRDGLAGAPSAGFAATPGLAPPQNLRVVTLAGNSLTLAWNPSPIGILPTGFVIEGGPGPQSEVARVPAEGLATVLTVSAPVGVFHIRVRSTLGQVDSEPSPEIRVNVGVPESPSAPSDLLGLADGSSVLLTWQNTFAGGAPTSIVLDVTGAAAGSIPLAVIDRFSVAGVPPGTYSVSVRAVNSSGSSGPSNPVTLTVPGTCASPQVPTQFSASKIGQTIVAVWSPPAAGPAPDGYLVGVTGSFHGSLQTTELTLSGAAGPGTYVLSVAATNGCGTSAATPAQTVTIP